VESESEEDEPFNLPVDDSLETQPSLPMPELTPEEQAGG